MIEGRFMMIVPGSTFIVWVDPPVAAEGAGTFFRSVLYVVLGGLFILRECGVFLD